MFMVVACEKEETSGADQQQTVRKPQPISDMEVMQYLPEVVDGRLVFKDEEAFMNYLQWIFENQRNDMKIEDMYNHLGFVPMKDYYDAGMDLLDSNPSEGKEYLKNYPNVFYDVEYDNSIIHEMQASVMFSYVANVEGVFQVGRKINRVSHNYTYTIENGNTDLIGLICSSNNEINSHEEIVCESLVSQKQQYNYKTMYFDSQHRLVIRLHEVYSLGLYEWSAEANTQKYVWKAWVGKRLDGVTVSWPQGYAKVLNTQTVLTIPSASYSGNQTIRRCFYAYQIPPDVNESSCTTIHTGDKDGVVKTYTHNNAFTANY
ncbi:MAG: hypothetical protein JXR36_17265 [Bacteroidales bacterium]|nr:hypothetical protein [Bacteroidales bacterium]